MHGFVSAIVCVCVCVCGESEGQRSVPCGCTDIFVRSRDYVCIFSLSYWVMNIGRRTPIELVSMSRLIYFKNEVINTPVS